MLISKIIKKLQDAQKQYGDHPVATYDGFIGEISLSPAKDGVCYPLEPGTHNEIGIEIMTAYTK